MSAVDSERPVGLLGYRYWPAWAGLGLLWLLHRGLPERVSRWAARTAARGLARVLLRRSAKRAAIARVNLKLCFPQRSALERERMLRAHFRALAQGLVDYGLLWFGGTDRLRRRVELEGESQFRRLLDAGVPVILLAPHTSALDYGGLRMSVAYSGVAFTKPMKNRLVEWINGRSRARYGGVIVHRDQGLRPVIRELRRGRFFYYLPDEDLGPDGAVFAPFMGVPKATLTALGRVARLSQAAVLPAWSWYDAQADVYRMRVSAPLEDFPSGDEMADARTMNAAIESMLAIAPEQYVWTMKMFRTRPAGETSPYARRVSRTAGRRV